MRRIAVRVREQEIEPPCVRLPPLLVFEDQVAEPKDARVVRYPLLDPAFVSSA